MKKLKIKDNVGKPVEIKPINLFEVNGIQYSSNIPNYIKIGITKEEYVEYIQLKEKKQGLVKYLENKIVEGKYATAYQDILERIKSGKYE